jgi:hypothetical protein
MRRAERVADVVDLDVKRHARKTRNGATQAPAVGPQHAAIAVTFTAASVLV